MIYELSIAIEPVSWERNGARAVGNRIIEYKREKTRTYEDELATIFKRYTDGPLEGPLKTTIRFDLPIPESWSLKKKKAAIDGELMHTGKKDVDNLAKAVMDAGNKILWNDDGQIVEAHISKRYAADPTVYILVEPYEVKL